MQIICMNLPSYFLKAAHCICLITPFYAYNHFPNLDMLENFPIFLLPIRLTCFRQYLGLFLNNQPTEYFGKWGRAKQDARLVGV